MESLRLGSPRSFLWKMDKRLLSASTRMKVLVIVLTFLFMIAARIWLIPEEVVDLDGINKYNKLGGDYFADNYTGKVVRNDPMDMYTKENVDLNERESDFWEKEDCSPYPPLALFVLGAIHFFGDVTGIGFIGTVYLIDLCFALMILIYCLKTRWYLFTLTMLNVFLPYRVYTKMGTTNLFLLVIIMVALLAARYKIPISHHLMAAGMGFKFMTVFYINNLFRMDRKQAFLYIGVIFLSLILPILIFDNYLYIYSFHATRGYSFVSHLFDHFHISMTDTIAVVFTWTVPTIFTALYTIVLFYIENRLNYDWEERIGWSAIPFALFIGLRLLTVRFFYLMLLIPDKRGTRTFLFFLLSLFHMSLFLPEVRRFAVDGLWGIFTICVFTFFLIILLRKIGWERIKSDLSSPVSTMKMLFTVRPN